eukprot:COSAG04_NODE_1143_length_8086_cov_8.040566_6_plen_235_part_00
MSTVVEGFEPTVTVKVNNGVRAKVKGLVESGKIGALVKKLRDIEDGEELCVGDAGPWPGLAGEAGKRVFVVDPNDPKRRGWVSTQWIVAVSTIDDFPGGSELQEEDELQEEEEPEASASPGAGAAAQPQTEAKGGGSPPAEAPPAAPRTAARQTAVVDDGSGLAEGAPAKAKARPCKRAKQSGAAAAAAESSESSDDDAYDDWPSDSDDGSEGEWQPRPKGAGAAGGRKRSRRG